MIVTFSICTDVTGSVDDSQIELLPNPNEGDLTITLSRTFTPTQLIIYNTNSEKVRDQTIAFYSNTLHLDLHELKKGIYIILLKDAEGKQMVKRMIKK